MNATSLEAVKGLNETRLVLVEKLKEATGDIHWQTQLRVDLEKNLARTDESIRSICYQAELTERGEA